MRAMHEFIVLPFITVNHFPGEEKEEVEEEREQAASKVGPAASESPVSESTRMTPWWGKAI